MVNSKKKGNAWENKIAKELRDKFVPLDFDVKTAHSLVHRTPMSGGHVERGDLIIKPPIWKWFPWFIECRNRESWSWKNVMEKGMDSVIGKWFQEDAIDKCHPYDNDARYHRRPLLLFTRNHEQVYGCARVVDLRDVIEPALWKLEPVLMMQGQLIMIFPYKQFLGCYEDTPEGIIDDIKDYLGGEHV